MVKPVIRSLEVKSTNNSLTRTLLKILNLAEAKDIRVGDILDQLTHRGHLIPIIVLAFPFVLPIPLPGLSVPFGVLIALIGCMMLFERPPWVPGWVAKAPIPSSVLVKILRRAARICYKFERRTGPRFSIMTTFMLRKASLLLIIICGGLLALPLPPGTNFLPGLTIVLLAVGKLRADGVCIALGFVTFALNLAFFNSLRLMFLSLSSGI